MARNGEHGVAGGLNAAWQFHPSLWSVCPFVHTPTRRFKDDDIKTSPNGVDPQAAPVMNGGPALVCSPRRGLMMSVTHVLVVVWLIDVLLPLFSAHGAQTLH
ncbi:hypothetical protein LZ31DRAFT_555645 [Colletotrichum somersetense]|nr:hypothetical protein LZ31DRAFT_555645 [Colletotrichum somersetense]